eukprot:1794633-Pleurochrysis_carterae.AAC.1
MPLLSAYPSTVGTGPALALVCNAPYALARSALFVMHAAIVVDDAVDEAFYAALHRLNDALWAYIKPPRDASTSDSPAAAPSDNNESERTYAENPQPSVSAPPSTPARVMFASRRRRNSSSHSRHLDSGLSSICFVVDSGCTWHIHPHRDDLINIRPCTDRVTGIDGRTQR